MTLKEKIIEKFKNDHDLLYRTLERKIFNHMSVFKNDETTVESLKFLFGSWKFDNFFDESRTEKFFKFNTYTDVFTYYDDLESALEEALQNLDIIAEYISKHAYEKGFIVLEEIEAEEKML